MTITTPALAHHGVQERARAASACSCDHAAQPVGSCAGSSVRGIIAMQSTGQGATHRSQPVHRLGRIVCICLAAPRIASTGHAWMHRVQPMHSASSM